MSRLWIAPTFVFLLTVGSAVFAVEEANPPLVIEDVQLSKYLKSLKQGQHNLEVTTTNPNSNRRGLQGDIIFYNDGTGYRFCRNTSTTPEGGTSWTCDAFSSATQLCFEGATEDTIETCFAITDPTASDKTVTIPNASLDFSATSPGLTLSTSNASGSATTFVRTDATVTAFDATVPAALGTAATGSAAVAARRDHVHEKPVPIYQYVTNTFSCATTVTQDVLTASAGKSWFLVGLAINVTDQVEADDTLNIIAYLDDASTITIDTYTAGQANWDYVDLVHHQDIDTGTSDTAVTHSWETDSTAFWAELDGRYITKIQTSVPAWDGGGCSGVMYGIFLEF